MAFYGGPVRLLKCKGVEQKHIDFQLPHIAESSVGARNLNS